jgi:hypothetical protein
MAIFYSNFAYSGKVKIEVEGGVAHRDYDSAFTSGLKAIASLVAKSISSIPKEERPAEIMLSFGMMALPEGGFAITLNPEKVNFKIRCTLGKSNDGGLDLIPDAGTELLGSS